MRRAVSRRVISRSGALGVGVLLVAALGGSVLPIGGASATLGVRDPIQIQALRLVGWSDRLAVSGTWGTAIEVPGTASLNKGHYALVRSISCASDGYCTAGGYYEVSSGQARAFVVAETSGKWGIAEEVPGTAALDKGGFAQVISISCASLGNCSAGGSYVDSSAHDQAFVVTETGGKWGSAEEVPGTAVPNKGGFAQVLSVSCASAGDCSAGGYYSSSPPNQRFATQAFVVSEINGKWGTAEEVPGTAALNKGGFAQIPSLSCAAVGECSAGGFYASSNNAYQAFVVRETGGKWGRAEEVPGTAALNKGGNAGTTSVSCAAAGDCSAGGYYSSGSKVYQAFVVRETGGKWGRAEEVPGTGALNKGGNAGINSISCAAAGDCSAGGVYSNSPKVYQAFVVTETGGKWGTAEEVPGTAALNKGGRAQVNSVSCAPAGDCSAGGAYFSGPGIHEAFVATESRGKWGTAEEVPGTAALNKGGKAAISSLSCSSAGKCTAGGSYMDGSGHTQVFVVSQG